MTACFQWDRELKNDTVRLLNGYQLERFDKRGILAHLARDWRELSIHFLLSQNVPLLYPWTAKEEVDLRFACLAPSILAAFKERRLNLGNEEAERLPDDIASDPGFHQVFQYSYFLEEQGENYSKPKGGKLTIPKNALAFMKDFRTWSIRPVSTKKERASYLKLYHFGFIDGKAIFWRFRPLALSLEELARLMRENIAASMDVDSVGSASILTFPSAPEGSVISFPSSFTLPPSSSSGRESDQGSPSVKSSQLTETVSGKEGMAPPPSPRGRSASPRASTSRGGAARGEQQDSARHPPPRDRSPTPRLNVHVLLSKEEGLRIDAWTDQVLHVMEDQHFAELQKNHLWKPEFLDHAFLLLDTPNARVRFRLLACYSGAKTIGAILNFALLRCIPFRLAVPISSVPVFREARLAPAERALAESYYPVGSGSVPLEYGRNGEGFSERYAVRFLDLLKRPHVRRIASMGGALAWLAWKSGDHLVQDFMNGPSIQVTQYGRGWSDGREANPLFITSDELSPNDLDVLLGHVWDGTTERWVWPSEAILWEYCSFYSGEMTEELDRCLQYILDAEVGKGKAQARTKNGWYQFFRRTARLSAKGKEKDDSKGGDAESRRERRRELEAEFEAQEEKLGSIFKDDWARIRVRDIRLPGICR
ncbi:hypothetical protein R3P38DRAFT_2590666 [Favolaschia claudopus]|uniref:Uncharacterized protein n=1 Tax=Favolaschia claudopus TaxID=2862362 RepID=A0AAV9Z064_9AGAR